jgi:copper(I)-binding protein
MGLLAVVLAGCGAPAGLSVQDAWVRASPMADRAGAAYMVLVNDGAADRLIGVSTSAATIVEMHETREADGMMQMAPVDAIPVPANGQAELKPGGYHLMLFDLDPVLEPGDPITFTLTFENAGTVTVVAEVRDR